MLVVLPTYAGDIAQLKSMLEWLCDLSPAQDHPCLIVADSECEYNKVIECRDLAIRIFKRVQVIAPKVKNGWPHGANGLWKEAAQRIHTSFNIHWLWLEPDAIPLEKNWLRKLEAEYQTTGKAFLGHIYPCQQPNLPTELMSGVAIYPKDAITKINCQPNSARAWDVDSAHAMVEQGHDSKLIHHFWGQKNVPPTFRDKAVPGTNVFDLNTIRKGAVIFHRNKDGTLINLLRLKYGLHPTIKNPFIVVLPFCNKDAMEQFHNVSWQAELDGCRNFDCLLSVESGTDTRVTERIFQQAKAAYKTVQVLKYARSPRQTWPQGPNWSFQNTAAHMKTLKMPWLWMESDMKPLVTGWLQILQEEYARCGKAIMGSVVPHFGHLNGTSVYPANLPEICPKVMRTVDLAFDTCSSQEMLVSHHDAIHLCFHCWGIQDGKPHPFLGPPAVFDTIQKVKDWIPEGAVTFHRAKDSSLIQRLREMRK